ncbi:Uma2 family endonuclease [Streptomyces syringium]|uniref:Uma2 family endonuclease n=1 Tax=Streptomyces syringium TaxID=76729 RepID=UPI003456B0F0
MRGPWTREAVLALPEDSHHRVELVGGALMMSPRAGVPHRRACKRLAALLAGAAAAAGAPVEVLEAVNVVVPDGLLIPDIAVVDAEAAASAGLTVDTHDVLVVIEIASAMKPALCAAAGIPHYWRLELEPAPRLYLGHLERGTYTDRLVQAGETTRLERPFPLDFDPARLVRR